MSQVSQKFIIFRKIWWLCLIILIPLIILIVYLSCGFIGNKITPELKEAFGAEKIKYMKGSDFSDFSFKVELTKFEYPTEGNTDGTISYKYTYKNNTGTTASNINSIMCIGQYSANYVSTVSSSCKESRTSISTNGSTDTGSITKIAYSNKNAFGFNTKISKTPNVYIYITYDYLDEYSNKSSKNYVLTYEFAQIFTGYIQN